jgi:thiamine transport system permease protein
MRMKINLSGRSNLTFEESPRQIGRMDLSRFGLLKFLDRVSSKPAARYLTYSVSVAFFFALILIPPILGIVLKWNLIGQVFENPSLQSRALSAIYASFGIALFVSLIDVVAGLPLAWFISRGKARWLSILDTFVDIPFILPTVALGYSLLLFWSKPDGVSSLFGGSLISPGWLLVILLHFVFSYPIIVRVMVGALLDYQLVYEEASRTLGAPPLTADRTVTLSILKPSIVSSFVLAFARSISETGATLMIAGTFENGPVFISNARTEGLGEGSLVFVSFVLIAVSFTIFAVITALGSRLKLPTKKVWPVIEKRLSDSKVAISRNTVTLMIFVLIVLLPSLFIVLPAFYAIASGTLSQALSGTGIWQGYWQSLLLSYALGAIVTLLNISIGLPMAVLIARRRAGKLASTVLDVLVNVPLIVPSIALGVSMKFFWSNFAFIPEIVLLIFAHLSITYPYFVRAMASAVERTRIDLEEASRILGAKPFAVFRTIILPLTKYSLFAGALLVFTRSVDETGATSAVASTLKTAPVLLVAWVKGPMTPMPTPYEVALGIGFLVILSFIVLLVLRLLVRGKERKF